MIHVSSAKFALHEAMFMLSSLCIHVSNAKFVFGHFYDIMFLSVFMLAGFFKTVMLSCLYKDLFVLSG